MSEELPYKKWPVDMASCSNNVELHDAPWAPLCISLIDQRSFLLEEIDNLESGVVLSAKQARSLARFVRDNYGLEDPTEEVES